jgi:O-antigen/teichoic acid export membrane protein
MWIKEYSITWALFDMKEVKKVLGFSLSVQGITIFSALIDPTVKYMIGTYYHVTVIPAYEIARRCAMAISGLYFNAFKIILPKASVLKLPKEIKSFIINDVMKYSKIGITYSGLIFGVGALPIIFIIYYIFGMHEVVLIFLILSLPESINNFGYATYNFLLGVGKVYLLGIVQLNNLICVVLGLFIGFNYFHGLLGLLGYFFSVTIGNIIMVMYMNKKWNISYRNIFMQSKLYKLIALIMLMIIVISFVYEGQMPLYPIIALLSGISYLIFHADIHYYITIMRQVLFLQYLKKG